jgi:hypothetical protein
MNATKPIPNRNPSISADKSTPAAEIGDARRNEVQGDLAQQVLD